MRRYLQVIATGQWCAEYSEAEAFSDADAERYPDAVCVTLGLPMGSLRAVYVDADEDPREGELLAEEATAPAEPPDVNGFLLAAMGALGLIRGNEILAAWPAFTIALNARNWTVARQVIGAALAAGAMTQQEHDDLVLLLDEHHIPEAS